MAGNDFKYLVIAGYCWKQLEVAGKGWTWVEMTGYGYKCLKCLETSENLQKGMKMS